jgi:hypothetical protein
MAPLSIAGLMAIIGRLPRGEILRDYIAVER